MMSGWDNPKPDKKMAEYLDGGDGNTEKSRAGKKYSANNKWSPKPDSEIKNYLETGKSGAQDEPKKTSKKTTNTRWKSPKPSDEVLKYLGGASGRIGETLAKAQQAEPELEDYLETFEKWSRNNYNSDTKKAYESVGKFKPLPATIGEVEEFLNNTNNNDSNNRAGLFASYCLNEICPECGIDLTLRKSHDHLGAYNKSKAWRIHGNVGNKAGLGMSGGELVVEGSAGNQFCGGLGGGKAVAYGNAGDFAGETMKGGELRVNGNAGDYAGRGMLDGFITVQRNAGRSPGEGMKGGKLVVYGDAGESAGHGMINGELMVMGNAGVQAGLGMKGGKLTIDGDVDDKAGRVMDGGELHINGELSKGWTYELAYDITGGNIFHRGKQLYKDGKKVKRWLIF